MTESNVPSSQTKICRQCGHLKPVEEFRRLRRGDDNRRHGECRDCHNARQRQGRMARRSTEFRKAVRDLAVSKQDRKIRAAATAVIDLAGGVGRFADLWWEEYHSAKPGGRVRQNLLFAQLNLMKLSR